MKQARCGCRVRKTDNGTVTNLCYTALLVHRLSDILDRLDETHSLDVEGELADDPEFAEDFEIK